MSRATDDEATRLAERAAEWLLEMREPHVSRRRRAELAEWLQASPLHVRAYLEIAAVWGAAGQLGADVEIDEAALREPDFIAKVLALPVASASDAPPRTREPRAVRARLAIAAVIAALGLLAAAFWVVHSLDRSTLVLTTNVGEQRSVTLEDGSVVRLNARSELRVSFRRSLRAVDLVRGQAWFDVAKDTSRPFVVRDRDAQVRAIGTVFDINRRDSRTIVTVVSGQVLVSAHEGGGTAVPADSARVKLEAGEQASVAKAEPIRVDHHANLTAAISWLDNVLTFDNTPLAEVLEELNRYSPKPIVLEVPELAGVRINAVIRAGNAEGLLHYVQRFQPVRIVTTADRVRILRAQVPISKRPALLPLN
ncbi:MAG TPA: FecR domain-containing protein [Steroidobacteraceae bacterium]|nr:FecR domain-containing protein [Steroidobacteraceae bacterium]